MIQTLQQDSEDHVLIPHVPDWTIRPNWSRRWKPDQTTSLPGTEERVAMMDQGLVRLAWTIDPYDAEERGLAIARITQARKTGLACAPYWGRGSRLAAEASADVIAFDATLWVWRVGDPIFICRPERYRWIDGWELGTVATWNPTTYVLQLVDNLGQAYPVGAWAWPIIFGLFTCEDLAALNDHHATVPLRIEQRRPWPLNRLVNDSCSISLTGPGSGDSFNCYSIQEPITQTLNAGNSWIDPWRLGSNWLGPQAIENFEAYVLGTIQTLLDKGTGWTGAWTFRGRHIGVVAMETFNSYTEEDPITAQLDHGSGFTGAWTLRDLPP